MRPPFFDAARRAVLFDMDGLLVDSEPLWLLVEMALAEELGGSWNEELAAQCVGRGIPLTAEKILRSARSALSVEEGVALLVERFVVRTGEIEPKPGLLEVLDAASAHGSMAVASSSPHRIVSSVLEKQGILPRFGALATGDRVKHPKPKPDVFLLAAELLGVDPANTIVLEDSAPGAEGGRAAGAFVVGVPDVRTDREALAKAAHLVLPSLRDVAEWLTRPV